jgi:UDP-N-acetylglucosamine--N-acetylmuramyl-(pentapeptide) pyrophosphoryl-undecaprenol N-acetylglucosamine transferase
MNAGTVLIMAGGTGGHVFPGIAVARELIAQQVRVVWLGTRAGLEARAVPASGLAIEMEWVSIRGLRRTGWFNWVRLPFSLARAMVEAWGVLRRRRPDVVLSMGGFVAGPGGLTAWLTRTPLVVHEQNAVPGMTNRWLASLARRVLTGFPGAFGSMTAAQHVGNPVRAAILAIAAPGERLVGRAGGLRVLVIGGSQGARIFNDIVPQTLRAMTASARPEVWHQCGRGAREQTLRAYGDVPARVSEFIDDMAAAYAWADVVLCRAGAMTIAELAAAGCAAILVPYPHAVDDHQTANAHYLADRDAAILLPQAELSAARLSEILGELTTHRDVLLKMASAARACASSDAADAVAQVCLELIHA